MTVLVTRWISSGNVFRNGSCAWLIKQVYPKHLPVLLEPIGSLKVYVPDANTGDMIGELNKRRGRVLGMTPQGNDMTLIEAEAPISEMHDFTTLVRQMTQGSGWFTFVFERYEQLPSNLEASVIENAKKLFGNA